MTLDLFSSLPPPPSRLPPGIPGEVCAKFDELALGLADGSLSGYAFPRYSADAILHRIRWHFTIERKDRAFKCNNNWTAKLARWWMEKRPEHAGFFELRERVGDGYDADAGAEGWRPPPPSPGSSDPNRRVSFAEGKQPEERT